MVISCDSLCGCESSVSVESARDRTRRARTLHDALSPAAGSRLAAAELSRCCVLVGIFSCLFQWAGSVCFNAHRVFAPITVVSFFESLELRAFSLVDDAGRFTENVAFNEVPDFDYGCGMFEFVRPATD